MNLAIGIILTKIGLILGELIVDGVVTRFFQQQHRMLDKTIKSTALAYPNLVGLEYSINNWCRGEAFTTIVEKLISGERDFFDEIVATFIEDSAFYVEDDDETTRVATELLTVFFNGLYNELYRSDIGVPLLANRFEQVGEDIKGQITTEFAILKEQISSEYRMALAPEDVTNVEDEEDSEFLGLVAKIDRARDLIDQGLVQSARFNLERVREDIGSAPDTIKFRVITNLAACALAEGEVENACELFEEAYDIDPTNPKGIANAAASAHLQNEPIRAILLATKVRSVEPENSQATAVLLGALWQTGAVDEFETLIENDDWVIRDERCAHVVIGVRMEQLRIEEAISICRGLVDAFPDEAEAHLALSQCLFHRCETERHAAGYSEDLIRGFSEVAAIASRAVELLRITQLTMRKNTALVVRGSANAIIGETSDALRDFDEVLAEEPNHVDAAYNKGLCLLSAGEPTKAKACFELIDDPEHGQESLIPVAIAYLEAGEPEIVVDLLKDTIVLDQPTWPDVRRAEILRKAARDANFQDPMEVKLDDALERSPNDPKLLILSALGRDSSDEVDDIICRAINEADEADRRVIPEFLAQHFQGQRQFSKAADQLAIIINGVAAHPSAVNFLICLLRSDRLKEALDWVRRIKAAEFATPRIVWDAEIDLLLEAGDVSAALVCMDEIGSSCVVSSFDLVRMAAAQFRFGRRKDAHDTINRIKASELRTDPSLLLVLAQLKRLLDIPGYLEDAYLAKQVGAANPDVQLGYFGMYQGLEEEFIEPLVVGGGCAVRLDDGTKERWWHINDDTDDFSFPDYLEITDELAEKLVGKRVGEEVVLKQGLEDLVCEITAIQSKFVRAMQEIFEEFTTRFPGHTGFHLVSFENDDFSKLFETVGDRDEMARHVKELYEDGRLPFATFANFLGRSELEVWDSCTRSSFSRVRFGAGHAETAEIQGNLLSEASCISLDLLALLTVHELGLADHLRDRFDRVCVPQKVIDELQKQYALLVMDRAPSGWVGRTGEGRYSFEDTSEHAWSAWKENVRSILEFAESFDRIASYPLLGVSERLGLIDVITSHGAGAIFAGEETASGSVVVVSDDLGLSELGRSVGIDTVNTQAVLFELLRSRTITEDLYSEWIERLASLNYWFVRVTAADIVRGLEKSSYVTSQGTRTMINTLEGPGCSEDSAVLVATDLMTVLAVKAPLAQAELILNAVIAVLRRGRDSDRALRRFRDEISQRLRLVPFRRDQLLRVIDLHMQI